MSVEIYGMSEFNDLIKDQCESLISHYVREDPVKFCSGAFVIQPNGSIRMLPKFKKDKKKVRKELAFFEATKDDLSRIGLEDQAFYHLKRIEKIGRPYSFENKGFGKIKAANLRGHDVIILDFNEMIRTYVSSLRPDTYNKNMQEFRQILAHEITHRELENCTYFQNEKKLRRIKAVFSNQIFSHRTRDVKTGKGIDLSEVVEIMESGKIQDSPLEEFSVEEREFLYFKGVHNPIHYLILDESLAYAVQNSLTGRDEIFFDHYVNDAQLFEDTYFELERRIDSKDKVKPIIKEVMGSIDLAYNEKRSPLEVLGII